MIKEGILKDTELKQFSKFTAKPTWTLQHQL